MLQQTQVATVIPYYERFLAAFPTVRALAEADEHQVLRLWEGLGYYRRARQLHKAARVIVADHGGIFPDDFDSVLALPGIGRYTAGAILSFAFDQRHPILEANTIRVFARLLGYRGDPRRGAGNRALWQAAEDWLPPTEPGHFNQAMMELGSLVCAPKNPGCDACPVARLCPTRALGLQDSIPLPAAKPVTESVHEAFVVVRHREQVLLLRRDETKRWAGMWDFPRFELSETNPDSRSLLKQLSKRFGIRASKPREIATLRHGVTRFRITLLCYEARVLSAALDAGQLRTAGYSESRWVAPGELEQFALSVSARKLARLIQ